ncbi:hypothetical protein [Arthrobacter sp. AZCC_0090]|uniref:hypothetical protein n=1 Tax=Arthrobacter sp. AZCC_0090 TaxID=2735881 RepID=UPI001616FEC2|nr:hypothetical protein [Arthrobacter sp. AZCC_0090]MBB6403541.1 hypothetical protein [Arthrobacter sp. AZCC_0090]
MRRQLPLPNNRWPSDMAITVDYFPPSLALLLFVRNAWGLAGYREIPPMASAPDAGGSKLPDTPGRDEWEDRWRRAWDRAIAWYTVEDRKRRHPTSEVLRVQSQPGQELHPAVAPSWSDEYGFEGLDKQAFMRWFDSVRQRHLQPIEPSPERTSLSALIEAWKTGLDTVISMPYDGHYAQRITRRHLVVSDTTHEDPVQFVTALRELTAP